MDILVHPLLLCFALLANHNPHGSNLIQEFSVAGDGDLLLLPLKLKEKEILVMVDTGAGITMLDISLPLGERESWAKMRGAAGAKRVPLFPTPEAFVGTTFHGSGRVRPAR